MNGVLMMALVLFASLSLSASSEEARDAGAKSSPQFFDVFYVIECTKGEKDTPNEFQFYFNGEHQGKGNEGFLKCIEKIKSIGKRMIIIEVTPSFSRDDDGSNKEAPALLQLPGWEEYVKILSDKEIKVMKTYDVFFRGKQSK